MNNAAPLPVASLARRIQEEFPRAMITTDPPVDPTGPWFIDITLSGKRVSLQWRRNSGFGVTPRCEQAGYGEKPAEMFGSAPEALSRIISLLGARSRIETDGIGGASARASR